MPAFLRLTSAAAVPETIRPAAKKGISGDPVHTSWTVEARGRALLRHLAVHPGQVADIR